MSGTAELRIEAALSRDEDEVVAANRAYAMLTDQDRRLRRVNEEAAFLLADGMPLVWASRRLPRPLPARVAGADLVPALLSEAAKAGSRVFLLGGEGGVAAVAGARLEERYPGIVVAGTYEPPRAAVKDMNNAEILAHYGTPELKKR